MRGEPQLISAPKASFTEVDVMARPSRFASMEPNAAAQQDLQDEWTKDKKYFASRVKWGAQWRSALMLILAIFFGVPIGICMAHSDTIRGHSAGHEKQSYGGCMACSVFVFVLAIIWVSVAVEKATSEMDSLDAQLVDSLVSPLAEALLTQMVPMEASFGTATGAPWVANITNNMEKEQGALTINYFYGLISLNGKDLVMAKEKDDKSDLIVENGKSGNLNLRLILRTTGAIGSTFKAIPAGDWSDGYTTVRMKTDVEGLINGVSFAVHAECAVPYKLRELPAISTWPVGTGDMVAVRRAIIEGLRWSHAMDPPVTALDYDSFKGRGDVSTSMHLLLAFLSIVTLGLSASITLSCWEIRKGDPAEDRQGLAGAAAPIGGEPAAKPSTRGEGEASF